LNLIEPQQPKISHEKGISWDFDNDSSTLSNELQKEESAPNSIGSISEIISNDSKRVTPEASTEQLNVKVVKFNEEQQNINTPSKYI